MKKAKHSKSKPKATAKPKAVKAKPVKKQTVAKKASDQKILFVYGYGEDAWPRAAAFTDPDIGLAKKAAGVLGLKVFVASASDAKVVSKSVRSGNVYASGDGFAPKITPKRFAELMAGLRLTPPEPPVEPPAPKLPISWHDIAAGDLVLAESDDPNIGGYWETLVVAIDGDSLNLKARDFPEVQVKRDRFAVALLYNAIYVVPEGLAEAAVGVATDWEDGLKPGHLVLTSLGKRDGWYPAIVTKTDGRRVTAHWRDEPTPTFMRQRNEFALLYPARAPERP